mgnify:FL=1
MKNKIYQMVVVSLMLVFSLCIDCFAANINADSSGGSLRWDISGTIDATADSDVMVGNITCEEYTLFIRASGTVSITAAIKVSPDNSNWATTNTYTLSSATTTSYCWSLPTPYMKITYTITTGQIDDTVVYCRTK